MLSLSLEVAYVALLLLLCMGFALYESGYGVCATIFESFWKRLSTFCVAYTSFLVTAVILNSTLIQNWPTLVMNLSLLTVLTHIITVISRKLYFAWIKAVLIGGLFYPVLTQTISPDGILTAAGYYDAAGSGIVHFVGAVVALLMSVYFSKMNVFDNVRVRRPSLASMGFLCIWGAWIIFVFLMSASLVSNDPNAYIKGFVITSTAAAWGAVAAVALTLLTRGKIYLKSCTIGGLAGLVIVSSDPFTISIECAVFYGVLAGVVSSLCSQLLHMFKLPDPCSVISIHGPAGALGVMLVATTNGTSFNSQAGGLIMLTIAAVVLSVILCELGLIFKTSPKNIS